MMGLPIMAGLVLAGSPAWAGDIPYAPSANVPDYVATMTVQPSGNSAGSHTRIVTHHDGWVRVDELGTVIYGNPAKQITVSFLRDSNYSSVSVNRRTSTSYERIRAVTETGQTETHAGERCDVRDVVRRDPDKQVPKLQWLSCLTADGIEIATRVFVNGSLFQSTAIVRLDRRPVSAEKVELPANLLEVAQWLHFDHPPPQAATAVKRPPDFAMHMQWQGAVRALRRHDPWTYDETSYPDGRRTLNIRNDQTGQALSFGAAKGGAFERLSICEKCQLADSPAIHLGRNVIPESMGRMDSVLGEACDWFDMAPGTFDINLSQCLTQDKIPLKIGSGGAWGPREEFVADEVQRRELKPDEILPPSDVLNRSNWDFPG